MMVEYQLKISGVHYGANGDSVAGQKDTEEMHMRTREMLSWIGRERPIVVLSRLYYLNTPRQAFQAILALLMLRHMTCSELGIGMRPMTADEYQQDGLVSNLMDMPTTIGRVVAFGETRCDRAQKQTIELLVHWLRDDYEQSHPQEIESLAEDTQVKLANAIEKITEQPRTQVNNTFELVQKKETNIDKNYGPNIENNGTLSLPDKDDKQ